MSLESIKKKLAELEGTRSKKSIWKPEDEHVVRCIPLPGGEELGYEVGFHYGVDDGKQCYCPASQGEKCDFCDFAGYLYAWVDENGVQKPKAQKAKDFDWFKKISRTIKYYVPVVVRTNDPDKVEGPMLWQMSQRTYKSLVEVCVDEESNAMLEEKTGIKDGGYRVLTNPDWAFDVAVSRKKAGEKGNATKYDLVDVKPRKRLSELLSNPAAVKKLRDAVPTLNDAVRVQSSEEVSKIFAKFRASFDSDAPANIDSGSEYPTNSAEKLEGTAQVDDVEARLKALVEKKRKQQAEAKA